MSTAPILECQSIYKKFSRDLRSSITYGLRDMCHLSTTLQKRQISLRPHEFWAIEDVSFNLGRGISLGIVGPNGSGKSTLLKIICNILQPTAGRLFTQAKITPLLDLQAGLNPTLTGRENIFYYYLLQGFTRGQIKAIEPKIIDFAELGPFIDSPVYMYSLGMQARLGFGCALFTQPDIMLIDEVLSVGDLRFKGKGQRMMDYLKEKGTSFIVVSHFSQSILNLCDSALFLLKGKTQMLGSPAAVIRAYEEYMLGPSEINTDAAILNTEPQADIVISRVYFESAPGIGIQSPESGSTATLCIELDSKIDCDCVYLYFHVHTTGDFSERELLLSSFNDQHPFVVKKGQKTICRLTFTPLVLRPGFYSGLFHVRRNSTYTFTSVSDFLFSVRTKEGFLMEHNKYYQPHSWAYENL